MNTLDIVLLAILLIFTILDAFLGFINVAVTFFGLFLGVVLAGVLSDPLSNLFSFISDKNVARGVAFVLIVVLFSLLAHIISLLLGLIPFFGLVNHLLGGMLGLAQGVLICAVVLVGWALIAPNDVAQSTIGKAVAKPLTDAAISFAPDQFKAVVKQATNNF